MTPYPTVTTRPYATVELGTYLMSPMQASPAKEVVHDAIPHGDDEAIRDDGAGHADLEEVAGGEVGRARLVLQRDRVHVGEAGDWQAHRAAAHQRRCHDQQLGVRLLREAAGR